MKKRIALACGLLVSVSLTQTAYGGNQTTVGFWVDPNYTVTIPADTTVLFQESAASMGNIVIDEAQIEDGKCIRVSVNATGKLTGQDQVAGFLAYQILAEDQPFTYADYTTAGEAQELFVQMKEDDWKTAPAGTYTDSVAFQIAYVTEDAPFSTQALTGAGTQTATIRTVIPDTHQILIDAEHATVTCEEYEENDGDDFSVDRFAKPTLQIAVEDGWKLEKVLVNGTDLTAQMKNGSLTLPEVYEDQKITVLTTKITSDDGKQDPQKPSGDNTKQDPQQPSGGEGNNQNQTPSGNDGNSNKTPADQAKNVLAAVTSDLKSPVLYGGMIVLAGCVILFAIFRSRKKIRR